MKAAPKMIVVLLGWMVPTNPLPYLPSQYLQIYYLKILHAPGRLCCAERSDICLGFVFKLNSSSHLNTNSIWSNISSMLDENTQMLSRYNRNVRYWWSPRHISMRWQKLDLELDNPTGIWVNSYKLDDPTLNGVFWIYVSSTGICK